ncbi:hypothetical protein QJS04_geneDACA002601 [Acorus gramineus]|uniref:DNA-directed RNA polymerase III subunit n=1 Tax=Acorus gramineus TaxID=55184 RepID=A0AAV9ARU3_ACOGR|nr:hypothetical protein QJS04_geneDACA002601 [Acorus gramineus]
MSFRGRGRGRGRGFGRGGPGFGSMYAKPQPFVLFPEDVKLPPIKEPDEACNILLDEKHRLEAYWRHSVFSVEDKASKARCEAVDIECSNKKIRKPARESLTSYLVMTTACFPAELIQGTKSVQPGRKKLRWDTDSEKKLEQLEKREEKSQAIGEKDKEEKDDENKEEEENMEGEEEEESEDDGDYNQNIDFDDDEDDMNMNEGDDEGFYYDD